MKQLILVCFALTIFACKPEPKFELARLQTEISTSGNSWLINNVEKSSEVITKEGITY